LQKGLSRGALKGGEAEDTPPVPFQNELNAAAAKNAHTIK